MPCEFPPAPLYCGVLGQPAFLHVLIHSDTHSFCLEKDNNVILQGNREVHSLRHVSTHGVELLSSITVKISRCGKHHSGQYGWKTFSSDGTLQCDVTFRLQIHDHHVCSQSFCQPSAETRRSSLDTNRSSVSLLTPQCSSANTAQRQQICVNTKVFLLLCGALVVFLTLITALFCLTITLKRTSPRSDTPSDLIPGVEVLYADVDINRKGKRNREEGETPESVTVIYSEVAQEMNPETGNQTFTTYGLK
ncbi:uncharacterized protein LOC125139856 isoform X2 [Tachysurus fulvidraco]|nr:uncharacterized protein LOC125139856 isoform X2 [Tachysurus fulvidraco]